MKMWLLRAARAQVRQKRLLINGFFILSVLALLSTLYSSYANYVALLYTYHYIARRERILIL